MKYRPDIDGLRALAVLPVVFFHAGVPGFSGGFVGVDIFFVISGFLIARIISDEIAADSFSIITFYERRIRRIIPALFVVCAVTYFVAIALLLPREFKDFSQSMVATFLFVANILFWHESGYFDAPSEQKPLLHMWSLSVEEQFYIVFPLLLVFLWRIGRREGWNALYIFLVTSLAFSCWGVRNDATSAFYLPHMRAWELLLGAVLGVGLVTYPRNLILRELAGFIGISLIVFSVLFFSRDMPFPGENALLPCLGAFLIIWSGGHVVENKQTFASRLLSFWPMVGVGLISYSLYLWHWPIIVFFKYSVMRHPTSVEMMAMILVAIVISTITWRLVERPFRKKNAVLSRRALFGMSSASMAGFVILGAVGHFSQGWPNRFTNEIQNLAKGVNGRIPESVYCRSHTVADVRNDDVCRIGSPSKSPQFIIWGDSHANALAPAFNKIALESGIGGWLVRHAGCPPLLGVQRSDPAGPKNCPQFNDAVSELIQRHQIQVVILAARWSVYPLGWSPDGIETGPNPFLTDGETILSTRESSMAVFEEGVQKTLEYLGNIGVEIWVVEQVPKISHYVPEILAKARLFGRSTSSFEPSIAKHTERQTFVKNVFNKYGKQRISIINPADMLCKTGYCAIVLDNRPLYRDDNHLSNYGSLHIAPLFQPLIRVKGYKGAEKRRSSVTFSQYGMPDS